MGITLFKILMRGSMYFKGGPMFHKSMHGARRILLCGLLLFALMGSSSLLSSEQTMAQEPNVFACDDTVFVSYSQGGDDGSEIRTMDRSEMPDVVMELAFGPFPGLSLNGLGYNPVDNMLYAFDVPTFEIFRIDASGNVTSLGVPAELPDVGNGVVSGTFLPDGRYIVNNAGFDASIHVIEGIAESTPVVVSSTPLETSNYTDIVYNPGDGLIYSAFTPGPVHALVTIDPFTGEVTPVDTTSTAKFPSGALYIDPIDSNLYLIGKPLNNTSFPFQNTLYRVDKIDPTRPGYGVGIISIVGETELLPGGTDATSCYF